MKPTDYLRIPGSPDGRTTGSDDRDDGRAPFAAEATLDNVASYLFSVDMITAKLFRHGGSQAVRLPKAFRFTGTEVLVERQGDAVLLRPVPARKYPTFTDVARHLAEAFPEAGEFPLPPPRPAKHERAAPSF